MTNLAPSTQRTITTTEELQALVADALVTGTLDISHYIIDVEFNLSNLLKECGQTKTVDREVENDEGGTEIQKNILCLLRLTFTHTIFKENTSFQCITFNNWTRFDYASFEKQTMFEFTNFKHMANFYFVKFNNEASFCKTVFHNGVGFGGAIFDKRVNFDHATVEKGASFVSATFKNWAGFEFTKFNDGTSFYNATFEEYADFDTAIFHKWTTFGLVKFNGEAKFEFTTFRDQIIFNSAEFKCNADFISAVFENTTSFDSCTFNKGVQFNYATFNSNVSFDNVNFNNNVALNYTTFKKQAKLTHLVNFNSIFTIEEIIVEEQFHLNFKNNHFVKLQIKQITLKEKGCIIIDYENQKTEQQWILEIPKMDCDGSEMRLKIRNLDEESNAKIEFKDCYFYGRNVIFTNVSMKNVSIEGGNTVKGMLFDHCHFDPTQLTQGLLKNLKFKALAGEEQWLNSQDKEKIKERALVYASLKTTATEGGETQLANDFHFWQQYYQGKFKFSPLNTIYKYTSAYGQSVRLPLCWMVFILSGFTLLYCLGFNFCFSNAFCISLFSSVPFFGGKDTIIHLYDKAHHDTLNEWFWFCFGVQSLLQSFLAFQIGAAIRNKVKR